MTKFREVVYKKGEFHFASITEEETKAVEFKYDKDDVSVILFHVYDYDKPSSSTPRSNNTDNTGDNKDQMVDENNHELITKSQPSFLHPINELSTEMLSLLQQPHISEVLNSRKEMMERFGKTEPRVEYIKGTKESQFSHYNLVLISKTYLQSLNSPESCEVMINRLFTRISFDINFFQSKKVLLSPLFLPHTSEYKYWNKYGTDLNLWKNPITNLFPHVEKCYITCPIGKVWDEHLNMKKYTTTIISYNVLAQCYISNRLYNYCKENDLKDRVRYPKLVETLRPLRGDIFLIQEAEKESMKQLKTLMSDGCFHKFEKKDQREEGLGILIDKQFWNVIEDGSYLLQFGYPQKILFAICQHKFTNCKILVATTHLIGDPNLIEVQSKQTQCIINLLNYLREEKKVSTVVLGGDFNADVDSDCYKLFKKNGFKSSIKEIQGKELSLTFNTDKIHRAIDYIWVKCYDESNKDIDVDKDYYQPQIIIDKRDALPNGAHGSDHIPIYSCFKLSTAPHPAITQTNNIVITSQDNHLPTTV
ncbi:hypothetical protein ABK040_005105 [Willaertia magna]